MTELAQMISTLMQSRQTILPKRLVAPGPDHTQLETILGAAASAPDHGQLTPWRFVVVSEAARPKLAEQFARSLLERDAQALPAQIEQAKEKAFRAPLLLLVVVDANCGDTKIDLFERIVSTGCALQNVLLMATALGYGSALTSGKALKSSGLRQLFELQEQDHALCFLSIGTVLSRKSSRVLPELDRYLFHLTATEGIARGNVPGGTK
jgi:nitroreductase